jgi:hypothetical protein
MRLVATRGRLRLKPLDGSIDPSTLDIEIALSRPDAVLTFGDLRRAAETSDAYARHEEAHRLWRAVASAAASLQDSGLVDRAEKRAADSIECAGKQAGETFRQSGVKFDYLKIAADRATGMTISSTALANGCSTRTVTRAIEFVRERSTLLGRHPSFADQLVTDSNPEVLAAFYGVEANIMRWILAVRTDRRGSCS